MKKTILSSIIACSMLLFSCGNSGNSDNDYSNNYDDNYYSDDYDNDASSDNVVYCQACGGLGVTSFGMQCPTCGGAGYFSSTGTTNTGGRDANIGQRQKCVSCNGTGRCWRCNGEGWWTTSGGYGGSSTIEKCSHCYGSGTCQSCGGNGTVL